jgi:hypothetical protein
VSRLHPIANPRAHAREGRLERSVYFVFSPAIKEHSRSSIGVSEVSPNYAMGSAREILFAKAISICQMSR